MVSDLSLYKNVYLLLDKSTPPYLIPLSWIVEETLSRRGRDAASPLNCSDKGRKTAALRYYTGRYHELV